MILTDEAEGQIVGAVFQDPSLLDLCGALMPEDFSDSTVGELFRIIRGRHSAKQLISPAALQVWAQGAGVDFQSLINLYSFGGAYVSQIEPLAEIIIRQATQRQLSALLFQTHNKASAPGADPAEHIQALELALTQLNARGGYKGGSVSLRAAAVRSADLIGTNQRGLKTGISALDKRLGGLHAGDLIIVGGRPGFGKSAFADTLMRNMGYDGRKLHVAQQEMSERQLGDRTLGAMGDIEYALIRRDPDALDKRRLQEIAAQAPDCVHIDFRPAQNLTQLETAARETRRILGDLDAILVDYLQLMRALGRHTNREGEIREISQGLKTLAKRLGVPVIALAQLSRDSEKDERRPRMSDLRDSGSIEQDADAILLLFREAYFLERKKPSNAATIEFSDWERKYNEKKNLLEIHTVKLRQGEPGVDELHADLSRDIISDKDAATGPRRPRYSALERPQ